MLKYIALAIVMIVLMMAAVALLLTVLLFLACACAVGIPIYFMSRHLLQKNGYSTPKLNPVERLQSLYVEGKIDLFEFERRVAHLISVDRY